MSEEILWFQQIGKDDVEIAGGKGANLGELTQAGIAVPPGFVVSCGAFTQFLDAHDLQPQIEELLTGLDHNDRDALGRVSAELQGLVQSGAIPDDIATAIRSAYDQLQARHVAVRSSATMEDLAGASFAGQQRTLLNVSGAEAVVDAVKACWASLFETQAIFYRAQGGFDHMLCSIAVPVQKMVQSDRSGVMFTVNPVTNESGQMIIEAAYGLGEAVVSSMVTPDTYIVDKSSVSLIESSISEQESELVRGDGEGDETNVWREVPAPRRAQQKLSDEEIAALARVGLQLEGHYGQPQDIEWAIEDGSIFILQSRPVTTL